MNNIVKLIFITSVTLFLFACDSSTTSKKTGPGGGTNGSNNTFSITVTAQGLTGNFSLRNGANDLLTLTPAVPSGVISSALPSGNSYAVAINTNGIQTAGQICNFDNNDNNSSNITADVTINMTCSTSSGNVANGKIYYMSECAVCHRAGAADVTYVFSSSDISASYKVARASAGLKTNITRDMHAIGPARNLMGRFTSVSNENVADLEAFLGSL